MLSVEKLNPGNIWQEKLTLEISNVRLKNRQLLHKAITSISEGVGYALQKSS